MGSLEVAIQALEKCGPEWSKLATKASDAGKKSPDAIFSSTTLFSDVAKANTALANAVANRCTQGKQRLDEMGVAITKAATTYRKEEQENKTTLTTK